MDVQTPKTTRRSTRLRVEIPVNVTSLDRMRPYSEQCTLLVVSAQGCGFRSPRPLQLETPVMLGGLPGGSSVTARIANCVPLGADNKSFLIGAALYTHGNVWGIANPPDDWQISAKSTPARAAAHGAGDVDAAVKIGKQQWPYNLFSEGAETHPRRK
ncbi:MAG TPA: hypothetical protein VKV39_08130 [Candidatus Sulfotelmatobacter sp.]|nr:hypothetical protein [Candidatus Sulfotelmatobacter sp.]